MGTSWVCQRCGWTNNSSTDQRCQQCGLARTRLPIASDALIKQDTHYPFGYDDLLKSLPAELQVHTLVSRTVPDRPELSIHGNKVCTNKFHDAVFPADNTSIGQVDRRGKFRFGRGFRDSWTVSGWLRPEQLQWSSFSTNWPMTVFNNPVPDDIIQGKLGDCWLVAALSLVVEVPSILYKIIVTKEYNPYGMYQLRLCDRGQWKLMTVDDQFPVNDKGFFIFTYAKRRQLFASLIEKAFAKLHGHYTALKSGRCDEGLQALTGEPTEVLFLRSSSGRLKTD